MGNKFDELYQKVKQEMNESKADDGDGKVESKEELKGMAMEIGKEIFGDDLDEKKIDAIVDEIISQNTDENNKVDWETAAGSVQSALTS